MKIGRLRRILLMPFDCTWNAWVRDFTAWLEAKGLLGDADDRGGK